MSCIRIYKLVNIEARENLCLQPFSEFIVKCYNDVNKDVKVTVDTHCYTVEGEITNGELRIIGRRIGTNNELGSCLKHYGNSNQIFACKKYIN